MIEIIIREALEEIDEREGAAWTEGVPDAFLREMNR